MKISVTVSESDYVKFNEYYMLNTKQGKKTLAIWRAMMPVISIMLITLFAVIGMERKLLVAEIVVLLVVSVIWIIRAPGMCLKEMKKNIGKLKADGRLPYTEKAVLDFADDAIIETTENSMKRVSYSEITRIGNTSEHIFIFFGAVEAFVIPKWCVNDVKEELEALLHQRVHG